MVVRIRFSMHGQRNNKFFHIVAINSKQRRDAKPIETLGIYRHTIDPTKDRTQKSVEWSVARIKYWLNVGAQPSKSAVRLFTQGGIIPPDSKYHTPEQRRRAALKKEEEDDDDDDEGICKGRMNSGEQDMA